MAYDHWRYGDPFEVLVHEQEQRRQPLSGNKDSEAEFRRAYKAASRDFCEVIDEAKIQGWMVKPHERGWRFIPPRQKGVAAPAQQSVFVYDPADAHQREVVLGKLRRLGFKSSEPQVPTRIKPMSVVSAPPNTKLTIITDPVEKIKAKLNEMMALMADLEKLLNELDQTNAKNNKIRELLKELRE